MGARSLFYRRCVPGWDLSVERHTENVPHDRRFHVVKDGKTLRSFTSERKAVQCLRQLLEEVGYEPPVSSERAVSAFEEDLERHFFAKEVYWGESHQHQEKGGKGRQ